MKVIESAKLPALFRLLLTNNVCADAIIRNMEEIVEAQSVDPVYTAGGCYCRECKDYNADDEWCTVDYPDIEGVHRNQNDFCSYGEPKEAQGDERPIY